MGEKEFTYDWCEYHECPCDSLVEDDEGHEHYECPECEKEKYDPDHAVKLVRCCVCGDWIRIDDANGPEYDDAMAEIWTCAECCAGKE